MTIPINDLLLHNQAIADELEQAIARVISRGWYILGPEVSAFESEFAAFCGLDHCIGVGNGTDALELALRALDVQKGDDVITIANAGMYSTTAIRVIGAQPRYVDIDYKSMTMDAGHLAAAITPRTRAIIVTHLYGQMGDMPVLTNIANQAGVPLVEDCAQAHGALLETKRAGAWGAIGCFSFYPTKNLGALGDGGALVTSDPTLADRVRMLRQYGWDSKYHSALPGGRNSRLDEIQAAVLRVKLPYVERWNTRRAIAETYSNELQDLDLFVPTNFNPDYTAHLYVVRTDRRDQLKVALTAKGISSEVHYPIPDHHQPSLKGNRSGWHLPVTEQCSRQVLTLPCFPEMREAEIDEVIEAIRRSFAEFS